jgi:hypothetical protein
MLCGALDDQIGGTFGDHDDRRVDVATDQIRKNRCVDHAQSFDSAYAQTIVDHCFGVGVYPHLACSGRMMRGDCGLPRISFNLRLGRGIGTRTDLAGDKRLELRAMGKFAKQDDALAQRLPVIRGR